MLLFCSHAQMLMAENVMEYLSGASVSLFFFLPAHFQTFEMLTKKMKGQDMCTARTLTSEVPSFCNATDE